MVEQQEYLRTAAPPSRSTVVGREAARVELLRFVAADVELAAGGARLAVEIVVGRGPGSLLRGALVDERARHAALRPEVVGARVLEQRALAAVVDVDVSVLRRADPRRGGRVAVAVDLAA